MGSSVYWFTGLSGSGKTTIAIATKNLLEEEELAVLILDGDEIRKHSHSSLGFSKKDIQKNNSGIVKLCQQYRNKYDIIFVAVISPLEAYRLEARKALKPSFYEVYIQADIDLLQTRDTKGLYAKAIRGEIKNMIGFSRNAPYESPRKPDIIINTNSKSVAESVSDLHGFIKSKLNRNINLDD